MTGVQVYASTGARLLASATLAVALAGCASPAARTANTSSGVFLSADVGAANIQFDTLGDTLEAEEEVTPAIQLGLGYQANQFTAIEARVGDIGTVEFTDGRELTYRVADLTGIAMVRENRASAFARLGVGTFMNEGDFDVELESPVHVVVGGGFAIHVNPNLDLRFSVNAHGSDAFVGSAGLVWRIGRGQPAVSRPRISNPLSTGTDSADTGNVDASIADIGNNNEGFEAIAPVEREEENDGFQTIAPVERPEVAIQSPGRPSTQPSISTITPRQELNNSTANDRLVNDGSVSNGLVIDEKPLPTLQTFPEPIVPSGVDASIESTSNIPIENTTPAAPLPPAEPITQAPEPITETSPQLTPEPAAETEQDPINITATSNEELFVVDTLLTVEPLQFLPGDANLSVASTTDLDAVSEILKSNPELRLQVESHAAPVGNAELNMLLSRRRALTVIRLLVDRGIDPVRLRPRAFGDTAPLAGAESINNNDRVEFRVRQ